MLYSDLLSSFQWCDIAVLFAPARGHVHLISFILSKGLKVDVADKDGMTPLHLACMHGQVGAVTTLLEYGANPQTLAFRGETPMSIAMERRNIVIARALQREISGRANLGMLSRGDFQSWKPPGFFVEENTATTSIKALRVSSLQARNRKQISGPL